MSAHRWSPGLTTIATIVAGVIGAAPRRAAAQECPCSIAIDTVAVISGDFTGSANIIGAYDSERRLLYTTNSSWQDRVLVYAIPEDRGEPLLGPVAVIGRDGEGPGEFRRAIGMTLLGDTLAVYDEQLERISIFDRNHTFLDSFRAPGRGKLNVLATLGHQLLGEFVSPLRPQAPSLKVLDPATGEVVRTVDRPDPERPIRYALSIAGARQLAVNEAGTVFVAWRTEYGIEVFPWDSEPFALEGVREDFVSRSYLDDFRPSDGSAEADSGGSPFEAIQDAIWVDPGTGWIATLLYLPTGLPAYEPGSYTRTIEIWDADTGAVRASLSNAPPIEAHVGDGFVVGADDDAAGYPRLTLSRVRVTTEQGGSK